MQEVNSHIKANQEAIRQAQEAAKSETKTVASEEPETGKERMQLEIELFGRRLDESVSKKALLHMLNYSKKFTVVEPGALVETSIGYFFICLSADEIEINGTDYCPISLVSPIGQVLKDKQAGQSAEFRGRYIKVIDVA